MNKFLDKLSIFLATGFGVGFIKYAPGTFGSVVGVGLYLLIHSLPIVAYIGVMIATFIIGIIVSDRTDLYYNSLDNKRIVIDEIVGILITFSLVKFSWLNIAIGFALFRFFDITKILFIKKIDKNLKNGLGIMLDDVVAGIYAGGLLVLIDYIIKI